MRTRSSYSSRERVAGDCFDRDSTTTSWGWPSMVIDDAVDGSSGREFGKRSMPPPRAPAQHKSGWKKRRKSVAHFLGHRRLLSSFPSSTRLRFFLPFFALFFPRDSPEVAMPRLKGATEDLSNESVDRRGAISSETIIAYMALGEIRLRRDPILDDLG